VNNKIFYLTRSYHPYIKSGGALIRAGAVECLKELGWDVTVVMPNYDSKYFVRDSNVWRIPFKKKHLQKISSLYERVGIYEDYLDKWVEHATDFLKKEISKDDIVLATSGGELGMIKLGSILRNITGCKLVINFHDPLNYGYMNGLKRDRKPHVSREFVQEKYLKNSQLIITSSEYYANTIRERFESESEKVHNNYFGYIKPLDLYKFKKNHSEKINIAYAGIMSSVQKPELLYHAFRESGLDKEVNIYYIGDTENYRPIHGIQDKNVHFINFLPHNEFLKFMSENIDVGFVSLTKDYFGACVPSKIYEYINLGLPILGALPNGDAKDIINKNEFGLACRYDDSELLVRNFRSLLSFEKLSSYKKNIIATRHDFAMSNKIKELHSLLKSI
jgi:hypothetical protein